MVFLGTVVGVLLAAAASAQSLYPGLTDQNHTCVIKPQILSCPAANASNVDSCCAETFGGLVLHTQFWSTWTGLEEEGQLLPPNSWTIHGLWPDFCNGSYTQYCDLSRQYDPVPSPNTTNGLPNGTFVPPWNGSTIDTFVEAFGREDLVEYMNKYWINQRAPNTELWAHEYSKHATCFSNFQVPCYGPQFREHEDVVDYFETTIQFDNRYPTWGWLSQAGILPSNTTQYTLSDIQGTLTNASGSTPFIGCSGPRYNTTEAGRNSTDTGRTVVSEAWYYSHVYGRVQNGIAVPVDAGSFNSTCARAADALWYYEPTPSSLQQD